jgi:hypothetical protein
VKLGHLRDLILAGIAKPSIIGEPSPTARSGTAGARTVRRTANEGVAKAATDRLA